MKVRLMMRVQESGVGDDFELFEWNGAICVMGRRQCELVLGDPYTSHRHALLYQGMDGRLRLRDLESTNGTFINGRRVSDSSVSVGDEIRVGRTVLSVFEFSADHETENSDSVIRAASAQKADPHTGTQTRRWESYRQPIVRNTPPPRGRKASAA